MRILCLHGAGTNSHIFELQTAAIRYQLRSENYEYEYVDGTISWPPHAETNLLLASTQSECFAYFERNIDSLRTALQDLHDYIIHNGPFDAVLGFSQGASLAASYIAQRALDPAPDPNSEFKCAIFICGTYGLHSGGEGRILSVDEDGEIIQIPTVHIFGSKDPLVQESLDLSRICDQRSRVMLDHKGGHEVPRGA
ncbi:uncharacterized protein LY89DRAFT_538876, partial [Mollisia scopiformis]